MHTVAMLELSDGSVATVDSEDLGRVARYEWFLSSGSARYPIGSQCGRINAGQCEIVYLHRLIANAGPEDLVIHRNRNTLDNRRENLCVVGRLHSPAYLPTVSEALHAEWRAD